MSEHNELVKRLERERNELDAVVEQRNAECSRNFKELADARAEIERKDAAINRAGAFLSQGSIGLATDTLREALATQAPTCPPCVDVPFCLQHGCKLEVNKLGASAPMDELQRLGQEYDAAPSKDSEDSEDSEGKE